MTKQFILVILLFIFIIEANGQSNLPPAYDIVNDTALHTEIPAGFWKMLEDKEGKLTFQQVIQSPVTDEFHFNQSKSNQFDYTTHTYWFCYRLRNTMNHDVEIGFGYDNIQNGGNEQSTFYLKQDGKWSKFENGLLAPYRKSKGLVLNNYIPVILKPGEELTVYNRVHNTFIFPFTSGKYSIFFDVSKKILEQKYVQDESLYISAVHDSILFGILLFACVFNFFFFLIVKERVYLYFALYVFFLAIGRMLFETYFVFLRESRFIWGWLYVIVYNATFFLLVYFIRSLLNTRILLPRWDRLLNRLNYAVLIFNFLSSFSPYLIPSVNDPNVFRIIFILGISLSILLMACILLTFGIVLKRRDSSNKILMRLILPALCIWGVGWSVDILYSGFGIVLFSINFTIWLDDWWYYIESVCLCWLVLSYSWILLQRFRKLQNRISQQAIEKEKEKSALIEQKKIELETTVEKRTAELKLSLETLQSAQHQLIQSEKMASLGELTAGIAHEIQNPLNFMNNFSEVNKELIEEMKQELSEGNVPAATVIANNIQQNEDKINHHGKRADAIVKGMLQHSQTSAGKKEPTDINALADEYLRLAYHGYRAREKFFNVMMRTNYDESIGKINVISQDMGRVLLNLYNNAFYAVSDRKKQLPEGYEPAVSVITKKINDKVEIRIMDNGNGIPQKVMDKIFQPFFTTKPTGQGTGLGLSMSYDIIKAHGGELRVESEEGRDAVFVILIPVK
jgi:two-component system, NtrC family, sensor kinase